jgi:hypothetical protein
VQAGCRFSNNVLSLPREVLTGLVMVQPAARAQRGQQHGNQGANGVRFHRFQALQPLGFYRKKGWTLQEIGGL